MWYVGPMRYGVDIPLRCCRSMSEIASLLALSFCRCCSVGVDDFRDVGSRWWIALLSLFVGSILDQVEKLLH